MTSVTKYYVLLIFIYFGDKLGENVQIKDAIDGVFFIICNGQHKYSTNYSPNYFTHSDQSTFDVKNCFLSKAHPMLLVK